MIMGVINGMNNIKFASETCGKPRKESVIIGDFKPDNF
jgi:hypothetical protein